MSQYQGAGLERDLRQGEDEFPIVDNNGDQSKYLNQKEPIYTSGEEIKYAHLTPQPDLRRNRICGIRKTTFWLTIALAAVLSLGVVGAGIAGSLAVKRGHSSNQILTSQSGDSGNPTSPESANATCPTLPSSSPSPSTPSNSANCTHLVANDCESLPQDPKAYVSRGTRHEFKVKCTTDYPGNDMIGVFVYSFADCIEACASYNNYVADPSLNLTCLGVSYAILFSEAAGKGNCFLKSSLGDGPLGNNEVSSATVLKA